MTMGRGEPTPNGGATSRPAPIGTLAIRPALGRQAPANRCILCLHVHFLPVSAAMGIQLEGGSGRLGRLRTLWEFVVHQFEGPSKGLGRQLPQQGAGSKSASTRVMRTSGGRWITMLSALRSDMAAKRRPKGLPPRIGWRR